MVMEAIADIKYRYNGFIGFFASVGKNYLQHKIHSGLSNFLQEEQIKETDSKNPKNICRQLKNEDAQLKVENGIYYYIILFHKLKTVV